jgi:hypothetical protein
MTTRTRLFELIAGGLLLIGLAMLVTPAARARRSKGMVGLFNYVKCGGEGGIRS